MDLYQSAKEEIKRAADIVELIGQFVQLKRAGQNYVGLCPFHSEKAPSFSVSPSKQIFHCFGCKKGGDVFAFWMAYHQVPFPQAVKDLAEKYHIALPETHPGRSNRGEATQREALLRINETAAQFFHQVLTQSAKGKPGRDYFQGRSVPDEIIASFRLGYASEEWEGLAAFLKARKADMEKAVQAGLIIPRKSGGYYDRFRGRVIFPIFNMRQQVVGFGGRVLDHSLPKYLNSPETPAFQKGELLYGLHAAHGAIREKGRAVIVEGYTDALALHKHGFCEAVATLGTALTREHIRKLKGYTKEAVVVFDADAAGKAAALRSLPLFLDEGLSARVLVLPENEDPDSFLNKRGSGPFLGLLEAAVPIFDFYLDLKMTEAGNRIEGKVEVLQEMIPLLLELKNMVQRALYVRRLSERMGIAESWVLAEIQKTPAHPPRERGEQRLGEGIPQAVSRKADDRLLLGLFVHHPEVIEQFIERHLNRLVSDATILRILDLMVRDARREGELVPERVLETLSGDPAADLLREAVLSPPVYRADEVEQALTEFEDRVHRMRISESKQKALGNIEEANKIPKLIKKRWG
jgi:DNA primase